MKQSRKPAATEVVAAASVSSEPVYWAVAGQVI